MPNSEPSIKRTRSDNGSVDRGAVRKIRVKRTIDRIGFPLEGRLGVRVRYATMVNPSSKGRTRALHAVNLVCLDRVCRCVLSLVLADMRPSWLPDGYSQIFRIVCVGPFGLLDYGSAMLHSKI